MCTPEGPGGGGGWSSVPHAARTIAANHRSFFETERETGSMKAGWGPRCTAGVQCNAFCVTCFCGLQSGIWGRGSSTRRGGGEGRGGGGFGWDPPLPRVPLWTPPKVGQKMTEGAEAKLWLSASNVGRGGGVGVPGGGGGGPSSSGARPVQYISGGGRDNAPGIMPVSQSTLVLGTAHH